MNRGESSNREHWESESNTLSELSYDIYTNARPCIPKKIDELIESCRSGDKTKFEVVSAIIGTLNNDEDLSPQERAESFERFLAKVVVQGKGKQPEPVRDGLSRAQASGGEESVDSGFGEEGPRKRQRIKLSDMPWYKPSTGQSSLQNPSCVKSASIIQKLDHDLESAKLHVRLTPEAPRGIPMSEWEHIFKGEPVDLDRILSSRYQVSIGDDETRRKVETSTEWSTAWSSASRATAFVFGHRKEELSDYGDYILQLFAAKQLSLHSQIILYDKVIRNEVGGGQTILLTDHHRFSLLYMATMQEDGVEYCREKKIRDEDRPSGSRRSRTEICHRFNSQVGCRFSDSKCRYRHVCVSCGRNGHGKSACRK